MSYRKSFCLSVVYSERSESDPLRMPRWGEAKLDSPPKSTEALSNATIANEKLGYSIYGNNLEIIQRKYQYKTGDLANVIKMTAFRT